MGTGLQWRRTEQEFIDFFSRLIFRESTSMLRNWSPGGLDGSFIKNEYLYRVKLDKIKFVPMFSVLEMTMHAKFVDYKYK